MPSRSDIANLIGARSLFLGVETVSWNNQQFINAADFARSHKIDSLLVKCADGTNLWYGGIQGFKSISATLHSRGVGCIPYIYSYCNKFGALDAEIDILIEYMQASGVVIMDAEIEWDGEINAAQHLASRMQPVPGMFLVSTWSDPSLQAWNDVIRALAPATDAFMPQQYNDYLATFWGEFAQDGASYLIPTVNLDQSFGVNHPITIAQQAHAQKHPAISVWAYETAVNNPALLDQVVAAFPETGPTPIPTQEDIVISLQNVSTYFEESPAGQWLCKQTGKHIKGDILKFYARFGGDALCGATYLGLPVTEEINPNASGHPECRVQAFERGVVAFDPAHALDSPPNASSVYVLHIESSPQYMAISGKLTALQNAYNTVVADKNQLIALRDQNAAQISNLNQQIDTLKQQLANDTQAQIDQLNAQIDTLTAQNTQLTAQISGLNDKLNQIEALAKVS